MIILLATDVFLKGVWEIVAELKDPELRRLASTLPDTVLRIRADSTTNKYLHAFQRWRVWAEAQSEVTVFPVSEVHFALYLQHLGETIKSKSAVEKQSIVFRGCIRLLVCHLLLNLPLYD